MGLFNDDAALNEAAKAVRLEMIRLDYLDASDTPDGEDKAIAAAAIKAWLKISMTRIRNPNEYLPPT